MKATDTHRQDILDALKDSRSAADTDLVRRNAQFDEQRARYVDSKMTIEASFAMVGKVAEFAAALGIFASDLDDDGLAHAARTLQVAAMRVGNVLTQRRHVYFKEDL